MAQSHHCHKKHQQRNDKRYNFIDHFSPPYIFLNNLKTRVINVPTAYIHYIIQNTLIPFSGAINLL